MKLFSIFFFFSTQLLAQANPENVWKSFKKDNYSIEYPNKWNVNPNEQMGMSFIIFSPKESENDKFSENINLTIQDLTGKEIDLDKFVEISNNQINTLATNLNFIESKRIKTEKKEYQKIIFSADQGVLHLKYEQFYFLKNEKAYVLTFTSELGKFSDYEITAEKILNSFRFE